MFQGAGELPHCSIALIKSRRGGSGGIMYGGTGIFPILLRGFSTQSGHGPSIISGGMMRVKQSGKDGHLSGL
jgi:hypothetical protein